MAVKLSTFIEQPVMLITGTSETKLRTPLAPVGLGAANGMPPKHAQLPTAMKAAAFCLACSSRLGAVLPPMVQQNPLVSIWHRPFHDHDMATQAEATPPLDSSRLTSNAPTMTVQAR